MKNAEIGFMAKHVEKLILGAGLLVLLVVLAFYVLGDPRATTIKDINGRDQKVGPTTVETVVADAIKKVETNLSSDNSGIPEVQIPQHAAEFARTYSRVPMDMAQIVALNGPGPGISGDIDTERAPWELPNVPMPISVVAEADYGLLLFDAINDPNILSRMQQLVGNSVPADIRYVTAAAVFDMNAWSQRFERIPLQTRVPDLIYRNSLYVTGVSLKRQTLNPISKRWEDETSIDPIPGQIAFMPGDQRSFDRGAGEDAVNLIKTSQPRIARPPFPVLDPIKPWRPPGDAGIKLSVEQRQQLNEIMRKIGAQERQVLTLQRQLGLPQQLPNQPGVEGGPGPEFGGAGAGFEEFGPPRAGNRPPPGNTPREQQQRARLAEAETALLDLYRQRDEFRQGAMAGLATFDPNQPLTQEQLDMLTPEQRQELLETGRLANPPGGGVESMADGRIKVWAHDLTVQPGRTYRYKVVVSVLNPLFQNRQLNPEQVEANRNRISLAPPTFEVDAGEWSEPVDVEPKYYFFAVAGNANTQTAEFEVFRIFAGARQVEKFNVSPGDPIGGIVQRQLPGGQVHNIDMRVGAFAVDIVNIPGATGGLGSARVLYVDPLTNRIAARDISQDKSSSKREQLMFEVNEATQVRAAIEQ